jgi:tellurite methyltransferase
VSDSGRAGWEERHRGREAGGTPELWMSEMLPLLPHRGIALDVAAGRGRHSIPLAEHGLAVIAIDYSREAMRALAKVVHERRMAMWPVVANLDSFSIRNESLDLIVNVNYLDRRLFPEFRRALKRGGMLMVDTFLIDQLALGHPSNPKFMFQHRELERLLAGFQIARYDEGLRKYPNGSQAWRASAFAVKTEPA